MHKCSLDTIGSTDKHSQRLGMVGYSAYTHDSMMGILCLIGIGSRDVGSQPHSESDLMFKDIKVWFGGDDVDFARAGDPQIELQLVL